MNDRIPQISIGVPVFQGERHLREVLMAMLNQSFLDIELIISDNASTDATEEICREFAASDPRVRYYRNSSNTGPNKNYWRVFELARAPYFKWNSDNDVCVPNMLESCLQSLEHNPDAVLAYMKTKLIDDSGTVLEEFEDRMDIQDVRPSVRFRKFIDNFRLANVLSGLIRSDALRKVRPLGEYRASDIVAVGELVLIGKFNELPEYGFFRRMGDRACTSNRTDEELQKFYFPSAPHQSHFVFWRIYTEHLRSVLRADISLSEKLRLLGLLGKCIHWIRNMLWRELFEYAGIAERINYTDTSPVSPLNLATAKTEKPSIEERVKESP